MEKLKQFFKRPKDIGQTLNSLEGLKYLSIMWYIIGTNSPHFTNQPQKRCLYYLSSTFIKLVCLIYFPATMLINLFFIDSYKDLVANLSITISVLMSGIKQIAVLKHRQNLMKSRDFLKLLDARCNRRKNERRNILNAIHYSQLYCLYFPIYVFCGCGYSYSGWIHHRLIYNAWYPKLFANPQDNYLAAFVLQLFSQFFTSLQSVFNDIYPLCYLTLMIGHLESLAERITAIGWQKPNENQAEKNIEELKNCVRDHQNFLGFFECIRPLISITLFCQFLITALVLCLTAINLTYFNRDLNEQFFAILYLMILLIQIFPCCWHVNVLMEKSNYLTTAMYSCNWMDQNVKFRKMLIIFMQRSQKTNTILAGNLAPVTLQTFLSIIRFSFSMFTILRKM